MNDIAVVDHAEQNRLAQLVGFSSPAQESSNEQSGLPLLKINYSDEDDNENALKKGTFFLTGQEIPVYATEVTIRPLTQYFRWMDYDPDANDGQGGLVNKTLMITDFRQEARDEKGTIRCGKPTSKYLQENPDEKAAYASITCFRMVHALVSYTGQTATGEEIAVENAPALISMKGASFNAFEDQVLKKMPRGNKPWDFAVKTTTKKHKQGSVIYFTWEFEPDFKKPLPLDAMVIDTIEHIVGLVEKDNLRVDQKYREALMKGDDDSLEGDFEEAEIA